MGRGAGSDWQRRQRWGYFFIAPFFLVFFLFSVYPFITTFLGSFQKWDGIESAVYMGGDNYARLVTDKVFLLSVTNTLKIWLENFIPQMAVALALACVSPSTACGRCRCFAPRTTCPT